MKAILLGLLIASFCDTSANAVTASELFHDCKEVSDPQSVVSCAAYMRGLRDGLDFAALMMPTKIRYCPPENMDMTQFQAVVMQEFEAHPDKLHFPAEVVAGSALYRAFRCGQ